MNSRERVLAAVNHQRPDRVPIDLSAMGASGINAVVYDRMKKRLGLDTPTKIQGTMMVLAELEMEAIERLHVDVLSLDSSNAAWLGQPVHEGVKRRLFCGLEVYFPPGTDIRVNPDDGSWLLYGADGKAFARMPKDGYYFDFMTSTMGAGQIDPAAFQPSSTVSDEKLEAMALRARQLYDNTDKALLGWGASISFIGLSALLSDNITQGSLDEWLVMLMTEKETAHEMMGRMTDAAIAQTKLYHQAVGDRCFAWGVASDDAGTQRGEFISPDLFDEMMKPHYKRFCDWVHANTNWKTYMHSCGAVFNYIPHWIDAGIDILNPVQISAAEMSPEHLMEAYGGKIVFWGGGCDTQDVLPLGTPEQIRQHVKHNLEAFDAHNGGFVFTQVHNIQQDVPVENVEAMLAAAYEFGAG